MEIKRVEEMTRKGLAVMHDSNGAAREPERKSAATTLVGLARKNADFFHAGENCYATITVGGHHETLPLRSRAFKSWLGRLFFTSEDRAANAEAFSTSVTTLEGIALFEGKDRDVFVRRAEHEGKIYLDLADDLWRVVEVSARGWRIIQSADCPVLFRRPKGMLSLPEPVHGGSLKDLRRFLNVATDNDFLIVVAFLLGTMNPRGPYPVLVVHGEQGSAKSTVCRIIRALVDPNVSPLRSEPKEPRDLMIAANNALICAFDNVSNLPDWLSDCFCRLATGGGFSTRTLYTDDEEVIFEATRPVILNSIDEVAERGDLVERALVVYLPAITEEQRVTEKKFKTAFEQARPQLLGALLDATTAALTNRDSVKIDRLPRMADFATWITAAEPELGWEPGGFLKAYNANQDDVNNLPLENPIGDSIKALPLPWTGTATQLLRELDQMVDEQTRKSKPWPKAGNVLSSKLRRVAVNLRRMGIIVDFQRASDRGRKKVIAIYKKAGETSSASSIGSQSECLHFNRMDGRDGSDDKNHVLSTVVPEDSSLAEDAETI